MLVIQALSKEIQDKEANNNNALRNNNVAFNSNRVDLNKANSNMVVHHEVDMVSNTETQVVSLNNNLVVEVPLHMDQVNGIYL